MGDKDGEKRTDRKKERQRERERENVSPKIDTESGELLFLFPPRQELQTFWTGVSIATALLNMLK